ncbi:hypothetical protein, partial [Thiolapillus sp.]|uniref:hypothetical protein n=1 Tax=Thiolapillus sp. TaxID=2017437 RepID=UPI0025DAD6BF
GSDLFPRASKSETHLLAGYHRQPFFLPPPCAATQLVDPVHLKILRRFYPGTQGGFLTPLSGKSAKDFDTGGAKFIPYMNVFGGDNQSATTKL